MKIESGSRSAILAVLVLVGGSTAEASSKKSLVIGIDGMGFGVQGFDVANTPFMDDLIAGTAIPGYHGAYSDAAFAGGVMGTSTQQPTVSGPGWSTILTGVWTDRHGVTDNGGSFRNGDYANNPPYLGTLKEADSGVWTSSYVWWDPIDTNIIGWLDNDRISGNETNFHGAFGTSYDVHQDGGDHLVAGLAVAGLARLPADDDAAVFVAFDAIDHWGHVGGSSSAGYRQAIERADARVGELLAAITNRASFASEEWQIVITADHGHRSGGGHGGQSTVERRIPLIVASQSLSQGILDSGRGPPISHADVAPTVLDHFGIPIPDHFWGASRASGAPVSAVVGDTNDDGVVDIADLNDVRNNFSRRGANDGTLPGDAYPFDGLVTIDDLNSVRNHFGVSGAVPEPSSALLAVLGFTILSIATLPTRRPTAPIAR